MWLLIIEAFLQLYLTIITRKYEYDVLNSNHIYFFKCVKIEKKNLNNN